MRIAKYISNAGYCSRRDAEKLIQNGKVYLNNVLCEKSNINVDPDDEISIGKKIIKLEKNIKLWKLYKPSKVICTNKDPQKRKTIFDILPESFPRVISVGRLDFMSEGLLLLTNNGDFARKLELPSSDIIRIYRLCIKGNINDSMITKINRGLSINGIHYKKVLAKIEKFQKQYTWIIFKLREGKNKEIRNICKFFKWNVVKLIRIQYGSIKLHNQKSGEIKEVKKFCDK